MSLALSQLRDLDGARRVALSDAAGSVLIPGAETVYGLVQRAIAAGAGLTEWIRAQGRGEPVDLLEALDEGRVLAPIDHPDPAHCHLSGVGLSHFGRPASHPPPRAGRSG